MIPKVAHFYWHGEEELPPLRKLSIESFSRLNPDWQHFVHHAGDDSDPLWKKITQSDAARYGILYRAGGVYFDTDIVFTKPIPESWLEKDLIVPCLPSGDIYGVHVLGGVEGSPFYKEAMNRVKMRMQSPRALGCQSLGIKLWSGVNILDLAASCNLNVQQVPVVAYLCAGWQDVEDVWSPCTPIHKEALGVHWYGGDPVSRDYQNRTLDELPDSLVKSALLKNV